MKTLPLATCVVVALVGAAAAAAQTTYTLTEIIPPGAGFNTQPASINTSGAVCLQTSNSPSLGTPWVIGPAGSVPLETLPGDSAALPVKLFDNGRSAGGSGAATETLRPVIWNSSGAITELRRPTGDSMGVVISGNRASWLVGFTSPLFGVLDRPALWISGVLITLDVPTGFVYGEAIDVNAAGRIVGVAWDAGFNQIEGWTRDGLAAPTAIGQFPGHFANQLNAINTAGEAVGASLDDAGISFGLLMSGGNLSVFPPPLGYDGVNLLDINRAGQVVGFAQDSTQTYPPLAVIVEGQQVIPLEQLVDPATGAGWLLLVGQALNNSGQIVCTGFSPSGDIAACVLTPAPSPLVGAPNGTVRPTVSEAARRSALQAVERSLTTFNLTSRLHRKALPR